MLALVLSLFSLAGMHSHISQKMAPSLMLLAYMHQYGENLHGIHINYPAAAQMGPTWEPMGVIGWVVGDATSTTVRGSYLNLDFSSSPLCENC